MPIFSPTTLTGEALVNIGLVAATTTNANDSIKISGAQGALSVVVPGFIPVGDVTTTGRVKVLPLTEDVTINLTGAHWGAGVLGDLTRAILRVYAINDNGTLKFGVGYVGGRDTISNADAFSTATDVNDPEELLVNSALSAGTWPCVEIGYFYANFDDTGGAAEDLWAVQSTAGDLVVGKTPDGIWQAFNTSVSGFSVDPTWTFLRWTQVGKKAFVQGKKNANGTSNGITFLVLMPVKLGSVQMTGTTFEITDNGAGFANPGVCNAQASAGSRQLVLFRNGNLLTWTNANAKGASFFINFEIEY